MERNDYKTSGNRLQIIKYSDDKCERARKGEDIHMKKFILKAFNLSQFDGEGGAGTASDAATAQSNQSKSGGETVIYGKQAENNSIQNNEPVAEAVIENKSPEDLRAKYDEFMADENMKKILNSDTQKIINRRFKETKGLQEQLGKKDEILSKLRQRYKVESDDELANAIDSDDALWEDAAAEMGMSVEQYRNFRDNAVKEEKKDAIIEQYRRQEAARQQYNAWLNEAEAVKAKYPEFDLDKELQNPNFAGLISQRDPQFHFSMLQIYEMLHMDDMMARTAQNTEKNVIANIRAKGQRPTEGAVSPQGGAVIKDDVSKLTRKDRAEIVKRIARGEKITF